MLVLVAGWVALVSAVFFIGAHDAFPTSMGRAILHFAIGATGALSIPLMYFRPSAGRRIAALLLIASEIHNIPKTGFSILTVFSGAALLYIFWREGKHGSELKPNIHVS